MGVVLVACINTLHTIRGMYVCTYYTDMFMIKLWPSDVKRTQISEHTAFQQLKVAGHKKSVISLYLWECFDFLRK